MKYLLSAIVSMVCIAPHYTASACAPTPTGWSYSAHRTDLSGADKTPIIVFLGITYSGLLADELNRFVTVTVDRNGTEVPGALELTQVGGTVIWRAGAGVEAGEEYRVTVKAIPDEFAEPIETELMVQWPGEPVSAGEVTLKGVEVRAFTHEVMSDCIEGGEIDSCGGCEREVVAREAHFTVEAGVNIDSSFNRFIIGRIALGQDEASAKEGLKQAAFRSLFVEDAAYVKMSGGAQADWPEGKGCMAVEIAKPDGTQLFDATECFDVPMGQGTDAPNGTTAAVKTETETETAASSNDGGGCSQTPSDAPNGSLFILALLGLVALRRKSVC